MEEKRIRICRRDFPSANRKSEGKKVFEGRIQKRGTAITSEHQHSTIFTSKVPPIFPFMRNCEMNFRIGKKQKYSGTSYG